MKEMNSHPHPQKWIWLLRKAQSHQEAELSRKALARPEEPLGTASQAPCGGRERLSCGPGSVLMGVCAEEESCRHFSSVFPGKSFQRQSLHLCVCGFFWHISQTSGSEPWLLDCLLHEPQSCDLQSHTVSIQGTLPCLSLHPDQCVLQSVHLQERSTSLHLAVKGRVIKCNLLWCFCCCLCRDLLMGDTSEIFQHVIPDVCHRQLSGLPTAGSRKPCSHRTSSVILGQLRAHHLRVLLGHGSWETKASSVRGHACNAKTYFSLWFHLLWKGTSNSKNLSTVNKEKQCPF